MIKKIMACMLCLGLSTPTLADDHAVGANATVVDPSDENHYIHLVTAVGWTQDAGIFSVPVHLIFVPDVSDYYRIAVTTGINW